MISSVSAMARLAPALTKSRRCMGAYHVTATSRHRKKQCRLAGFEEEFDSGHGFFENCLFRRVADADVAFSAFTEGDTGGQADFRFEEKLFAKFKRVRDAVDLGEQIERAFGIGNGHAVDFSQYAKTVITIFAEPADHFAQNIFAPKERGFRRSLGEAGGAGDDVFVELRRAGNQILA